MTTQPATPVAGIDEALIDTYGQLGETEAACKIRRNMARRFTRIYGGIDAWAREPAEERVAAPVGLRSYAAWAVVECAMPVDVDYVVATPAKWADHVRQREPSVHAEFVAMAADLGFNPPEIKRMWAALAKLSVISGTPAGSIADDLYTDTRASYLAAVERRCGNVPKIFGTPVFGLTRSCSTSVEDQRRSAGPETGTASPTGTR